MYLVGNPEDTFPRDAAQVNRYIPGSGVVGGIGVVEVVGGGGGGSVVVVGIGVVEVVVGGGGGVGQGSGVQRSTSFFHL